MVHKEEVCAVVSLDEARDYVNLIYGNVSDDIKIKLKCWLHYCECRDKGGKKGMTFSDYETHTETEELVTILRSMLIDCCDIGGVTNALRIILAENQLAS